MRPDAKSREPRCQRVLIVDRPAHVREGVIQATQPQVVHTREQVSLGEHRRIAFVLGEREQLVGDSGTAREIGAHHVE